jgi:hypothetical protein
VYRRCVTLVSGVYRVRPRAPLSRGAVTSALRQVYRLGFVCRVAPHVAGGLHQGCTPCCPVLAEALQASLERHLQQSRQLRWTVWDRAG